jgi:hypothetical protein
MSLFGLNLFFFGLSECLSDDKPQFMPKSVDVHGSISDFRVLIMSVYQRDTSNLFVSHWHNDQQAVVSAALVNHKSVGAGEIHFLFNKPWHVKEELSPGFGICRGWQRR